MFPQNHLFENLILNYKRFDKNFLLTNKEVILKRYFNIEDSVV